MISRIKQYLERTLVVMLTVLLIIFVTRFFLLEPGQVNGQSMEPAFFDDEWFLVNKFIYLLHPPERYDIVQLFDADTEQLFVKRVIGLPGETVVIKHNSVFIRSVDGTDVPVPEPYLDPADLTTVLFGAQNKFVIPEHSYFVLGDNRLFSRDSREFGPVHRMYILGQVIK